MLPKEIKSLLSISNDKKDNTSFTNIDFYKVRLNIKKLFGEFVSLDKVITYLKVNNPSLNDFKSMLVNVREAQGFSHEESLKEAERVIKFNKEYINIINEYTKRTKEEEISFFEGEVINRNV